MTSKPTTLAEHKSALAPVAEHRPHYQTLSIDSVFGGYPLNAITREQISAWIQRLVAAGKKPPTVRYQYSLVRMVSGAGRRGWRGCRATLRTT